MSKTWVQDISLNESAKMIQELYLRNWTYCKRNNAKYIVGRPKNNTGFIGIYFDDPSSTRSE